MIFVLDILCHCPIKNDRLVAILDLGHACGKGVRVKISSCERKTFLYNEIDNKQEITFLIMLSGGLVHDTCCSIINL